jgi:creatinine amidohydrolase
MTLSQRDADKVVEMDHLSWVDIEARLRDGWKTAIFAVGSIEQHGPHMPTMVDALLGEEIAVRVARKLGDALVAPTVRPGNSPHHMAFPGTLNLRLSTITAIVVDYCTSLAAHGFTELVVISSHGGNNAVVKSGAQEAQAAVGKDKDVIVITNLPGYLDQTFDQSDEGFHATRIETSCVLRLVPELVRMDRARNWTNPIDPGIKDVGALLDRDGVKHFAEDGTMGKPETADAELGERALENMAANVARQIELVRRHRPSLARSS